jgi:hypothetical protein
MALIVVALHHCLLERPVHSFDLAIRPGMVRLGQAVLDAVPVAGSIEGMAAPSCGRSWAVLRQIGELDAVIGENHVDLVSAEARPCWRVNATSVVSVPINRKGRRLRLTLSMNLTQHLHAVLCALSCDRSGRRRAAHRASTQAVRIQPSARTRTVVARGVAPRTGEVLHLTPTPRKQLKAVLESPHHTRCITWTWRTPKRPSPLWLSFRLKKRGKKWTLPHCL